MDTKHLCVSLVDEALLIEEHRVQLKRLTLTNSIGNSTNSWNSFQQQISTTNNNLHEVVNFPLDSQNSTCPLPCSFHLDCQECVNSSKFL